MDRKIAVIGYHDGSAGQIESWLEVTTGLRIEYFVIAADTYTEVDIRQEHERRVCQTTDFPLKGYFKGKPVLVSNDWPGILLSKGVKNVLCLDGHNQTRHRHIKMAKDHNMNLVSAIHPSVSVMADAKISPGVWINAGCFVGYKAEIKSGVIMNTGAQVDHHNILEECCQLDPGVVSAGNVVFRERCHVHTGAVIINRIKIGSDSVVGAGSVVIADVPDGGKVMGNPARSPQGKPS